MKKVTRAIKVVAALLFTVMLMFVIMHNANGSVQFTKETGKKCLECHSKIPKKGESELYLTEFGKKFKENGNKLPKE